MKLSHLKSLWVHKPFTRVYFMAFFLVPVPLAFLWISLFYRLPQVKRVADKLFLPYQIEGKIERLKLSWSEEDMKNSRRRCEGIKAKVPNGYEAVSYRVEDLIRLFSSRGFEMMSYKLGDSRPAYREALGFSIIPLNVKLKAREASDGKEGAPHAGMIELVKLAREVVESFFGVDLAEISVTGNGIEAGEINLDFFLWVAFK